MAMASSDTEIAVIGAGAAGIAAARRLADAGVPARLIEARQRLGGRAWSKSEGLPFTLDLGCGWLHSADRNPWTTIARAQGRKIDKTPPPWMRPSLPIGFPLAGQRAFAEAISGFYERLHAPHGRSDRPASTCLETDNRWNGLINAVSTYVNGIELDRVSLKDFAHYADTGVNWRIVPGYGTVVAAHAAGLPTILGCPVECIDHRARRIRIETAQGVIECNAAIITVPSAVLAEERLRFSPVLPDKTDAAAGLPLGLADKLFLSLENAEDFEPDSRLFGRIDRAETATYHFRPFGRPLIEAYFGGTLAADLEAEGEPAFLDFALAELTALLGSRFAKRIAPLHAGASTGLHSDHTPTPSLAMPTTASGWPRRSTTVSFSPGRLVRLSRSPPRMAPISADSRQPTRRSRPGRGRRWPEAPAGVIGHEKTRRQRRRVLRARRSDGQDEPATSWVTRQMVPLPSSVTKSEPSLATATPTGRPQTSLSEMTKPVMKSSYSPVGLPLSSKSRRTTL
jgi:monoamine oxidase